MFEERDVEWLEEQEPDFDLDHFEFEEVYFAPGDVETSAEEIDKLLREDSSVCLVVKGNLLVEGMISIDEQHGIHVSGDVTCDALYLGEGGFAATKVHARNFIELAVGADEMMETCDVVEFKTRVWLSITDEKPSPRFEATHRIDLTAVDDDNALSRICENDFDTIFAALEAGTTIDEEWLSANA